MIALDMLADKKAWGYHPFAEGLLPVDSDNMLTPTEDVNPPFSSAI